MSFFLLGNTVSIVGSVTSININANQKTLSVRLAKLIERLVQRVRARLVAIFSSTLSASTTSTTTGNSNNTSISNSNSGDISSSNNFPARAFSHCLRALIALSHSHVAEEVIAETVTLPLAKSLLTQGKIDGSGGKGSYMGIQAALEVLGKQVVVGLDVPLRVCCETFPDIDSSSDNESSGHIINYSNSSNGSSSGSNGSGNISSTTTSSSSIYNNINDYPSSLPLDLIVKGVWLPVANLLSEKYPGMFSVGIAKTLVTCYKGVESFLNILQSKMNDLSNGNDDSGNNNNDKDTLKKSKRELISYPSVLTFHDKWQLDLYLQVS